MTYVYTPHTVHLLEIAKRAMHKDCADYTRTICESLLLEMPYNAEVWDLFYRACLAIRNASTEYRAPTAYLSHFLHRTYIKLLKQLIGFWPSFTLKRFYSIIFKRPYSIPCLHAISLNLEAVKKSSLSKFFLKIALQLDTSNPVILFNLAQVKLHKPEDTPAAVPLLQKLQISNVFKPQTTALMQKAQLQLLVTKDFS